MNLKNIGTASLFCANNPKPHTNQYLVAWFLNWALHPAHFQQKKYFVTIVFFLMLPLLKLQNGIFSSPGFFLVASLHDRRKDLWGNGHIFQPIGMWKWNHASFVVPWGIWEDWPQTLKHSQDMEAFHSPKVAPLDV